jgi:hypothetical protein
MKWEEKYLGNPKEYIKTDYNELNLGKGKDFCSDLNKNKILISEMRMWYFFIMPFLFVNSSLHY